MRKAALTLISLSALTGVAFAQTATTPQSPAVPGAVVTPAPAPSGPQTPSASVQQPTAPNFVSIQDTDMLSSNVIGVNVYDTANNDIGKIQDISFDANKQVKAIVLSVGGFLGMGKRYVAVTPDSVKIAYDDKDHKWHANMTATKDQLKAAPEFKYEGRWNASKS